MEQNQYKDNDVPSSSPRFRWTIENVSKLNEESRLSPVFTIGPHKWRLLAFRRGCNVNGYLSVYVVAVDCKISRCAKFVVAIVGRTNRNTFKHDSDQWTIFTEDEDDWGFDEFIQLKKLKDPCNGYIVNDACTIELELCLSSNSQEELAPIAVMESAEERDPVANSTSVASSSVSVDNTLAFICAFCQTFKVSESSGSMLHIANGKEVEEGEESGPNVIHVHRKCMEWAPKVYYDDETLLNLEMEVARGSKLKCKCCGLKGSALGCFVSSCKNTYHFPCAFGISGFRWDTESYLMLCPKHSGMKFPHEKTKKRKKLTKENSSSVHSQEPPALSKLVKRPFKAIEEPPASTTLPSRPCRAINSNMSRNTGGREKPIIHLVKQLKRKRRLAVEEEEEKESQVTREPKRKRKLIIEENEENESCDTNQFLSNAPPNNEEEEDEEQVAPEDPNCNGCDKRVYDEVRKLWFVSNSCREKYNSIYLKDLIIEKKFEKKAISLPEFINFVETRTWGDIFDGYGEAYPEVTKLFYANMHEKSKEQCSFKTMIGTQYIKVDRAVISKITGYPLDAKFVVPRLEADRPSRDEISACLTPSSSKVWISSRLPTADLPRYLKVFGKLCAASLCPSMQDKSLWTRDMSEVVYYLMKKKEDIDICGLIVRQMMNMETRNKYLGFPCLISRICRMNQIGLFGMCKGKPTTIRDSTVNKMNVPDLARQEVREISAPTPPSTKPKRVSNNMENEQQPKTKRRLIIEEDGENESCDMNQFLDNPTINNEEEDEEEEEKEDEEQVAPEDPNCSGYDKRVYDEVRKLWFASDSCREKYNSIYLKDLIIEKRFDKKAISLAEFVDFVETRNWGDIFDGHGEAYPEVTKLFYANMHEETKESCSFKTMIGTQYIKVDRALISKITGYPLDAKFVVPRLDDRPSRDEISVFLTRSSHVWTSNKLPTRNLPRYLKVFGKLCAASLCPSSQHNFWSRDMAEVVYYVMKKQEDIDICGLIVRQMINMTAGNRNLGFPCLISRICIMNQVSLFGMSKGKPTTIKDSIVNKMNAADLARQEVRVIAAPTLGQKPKRVSNNMELKKIERKIDCLHKIISLSAANNPELAKKMEEVVSEFGNFESEEDNDA